MCVCACVRSVAQLGLILCHPTYFGQQVSLSMGFSPQEHWSGLPFPPPGDLADPGVKPRSPARAGRLFATEPPGKQSLVCSVCL